LLSVKISFPALFRAFLPLAISKVTLHDVKWYLGAATAFGHGKIQQEHRLHRQHSLV
jgi:hypothetical protein